jgi:hypothetical protein
VDDFASNSLESDFVQFLKNLILWTDNLFLRNLLKCICNRISEGEKFESYI